MANNCHLVFYTTKAIYGKERGYFIADGLSLQNSLIGHLSRKVNVMVVWCTSHDLRRCGDDEEMNQMKRACLILALLLAGCSTHPENATETPVKQEKPDTMAMFVRALQSDEAFLKSLNTITPPSDSASSVTIESCQDDDLTAAWHTLSQHDIFNTPERVRDGLDILHGISDTGSKFVPPHLERIEALHAELQTKDNDDADARFTLTDDDIAQLTQNLRATTLDMHDSEKAKADILERLRGSACESTLSRYCSWTKNQLERHAEEIAKKSELNTLLACDVTAWARELRLNYPQNDYAYDRFRQFMRDAPIVSLRVKGFVSDMAKIGPNHAIERIEPPDPQYKKLIKARKVYLDAMDAGGWPKVENVPKNLEVKLDKSYTWVPGLRKRLAAEGYAVTDLDSDIFTEELRAAVELYRDLHQLNMKKLVDPTLVKNMAVPPDARLDSIDMTLQRYREAAVGSLPYYVKVNVPDFYVEVWKDGERIARHKIVVGNNNVEKDPETKKPVPDPETLYPLHPNRTPLQTSKINEIIYLPYWNVPARIRQQELEPKLAENPNYYIENNYEEVNVGDPVLYYVRELPNPKNSLGKVKLMFPNPHNTYLHDTPAKAAFNNPTRAFSHGCMRVQNPLDLAKLLLENDGQWNERKVNDILKADPPVETSIMLNHPVDVDVVYFNTRVDDAGPVGFLSDVYQYDAVRMGKVVLQKLPKPKDWKPPKPKR